MHIPRLTITAACVLLPISEAALAQDYPSGPVTYMIGSSPGGGADVLGRVMADALSKTIGTNVVVDTRAGAGGTVAAAVAADSAPDGYTVLQSNINHTAGESLYPQRGYNLLEDFVPVTRFASSFYSFVVPASSDVTTFDELLALIRSKPGELNYATAGVGSGTFMLTELLRSMAELNMVHIPYAGGGKATVSVVSGETDLYGAPYSSAKPFIDEGRLRILAVSSAERSPALPDVPVVAEFVPGFEFTAWYGLVVPTGTPEDVIEKIRAATAAALEDESVQQRLADLGYTPLNETPEEFGTFLKNNVEIMARIVRESNLKPD